jgi:hypothetical protein
VWRAVERVPGCFTLNTGNRPGPPGAAKRSLTLSITNWVLHDAFVWARGRVTAKAGGFGLGRP